MKKTKTDITVKYKMGMRIQTILLSAIGIIFLLIWLSISPPLNEFFSSPPLAILATFFALIWVICFILFSITQFSFKVDVSSQHVRIRGKNPFCKTINFTFDEVEGKKIIKNQLHAKQAIGIVVDGKVVAYIFPSLEGYHEFISQWQKANPSSFESILTSKDNMPPEKECQLLVKYSRMQFYSLILLGGVMLSMSIFILYIVIQDLVWEMIFIALFPMAIGSFSFVKLGIQRGFRLEVQGHHIYFQKNARSPIMDFGIGEITKIHLIQKNPRTTEAHIFVGDRILVLNSIMQGYEPLLEYLYDKIPNVFIGNTLESKQT